MIDLQKGHNWHNYDCYPINHVSIGFILRVAQVLDEIASELHDLCLVPHWSSLASQTCCQAAIHLTSQEMPNLPRLVSTSIYFLPNIWKLVFRNVY